MTPEQFKKDMEQIKEQNKSDTESRHILMDELMTKTLKDLGYEDGVEIFDSTPKWFA